MAMKLDDRWRALLTLVMASTSASATGCFLSHEGVRVSERDAGVLVDAGDPPLDASPPLVGCMRTTSGMWLVVEPITADASRCEHHHNEGVVIDAITSEPDAEGIRIHADYCPDADADCRCDIVIGNVGTDLAERVDVPRFRVTLDLEATHARITTLPLCDCLGCPCSLDLVFEAADAPLDEAGPDLALSSGDLVCPASDSCTSATWTLRASALGETIDVPYGEERTLGRFLEVRNIRNADLYAPCRACDTCGAPQASWVAWVNR